MIALTTSSSLALGALGLSLAAGFPPLLPEGPPQINDAVKVFLQADPIEGDLDKALLVCRVDIVGERGWDTFGAVDLLITLTAPGKAPVDVWGPEDRSSAVVSLPAFTLKSGQKLKIVVEDRDLTERELIARGNVSFAGKTPFRLDLDDVQLECRALPRADVEARGKPLLAKAVSQTELVEKATPDLAVANLGQPLGPWAEAERAIQDAASWLGLDDPDVKAADKKLDLAMTQFHQRARAAIVDAKKTLPPVGTPFVISTLGLKARVVDGPAVTLEISPAGNATVKVYERDVAAIAVFLTDKGQHPERSAEHVRPPAPPSSTSAASDAGPAGASANVAVNGVLIADDGELTLSPGSAHKMRIKAFGNEPVPEILRIDGNVVRAR